MARTHNDVRALSASRHGQELDAPVLVDELHAVYAVQKHVLVARRVPRVQLLVWVALHLAEQGHELCDEVACHSQNPVRSVLERHDSLVVCHNRNF